MKTAIITLVATLMAGMTCVADLYVDPENGKDSNDGKTKSTAFQTITKARNTIRSKKLNEHMTSDLHVYLRGGRYQLNKTLYFDGRDSGSGGFDVVYQAYKNELPVISGGRKITNWSRVPGKPYFAAPVPVSTFKRKHDLYDGRTEALRPKFYDVYGLAPDSFAPYFAQIYVNGVRAVRARSHSVIKGSRKQWWDDKYSAETRDGVFVKKRDIKVYTNPEDVRLLWLELFKTFDAPVASIIPAADSADEVIFKMLQPAFDTGSSWKQIQPQTPFFIINALEELDEAGEWYLDQKKRIVYYYPFKRDGDINRAEIYAPRVEELIRIDGYPMQKVSHIKLEGITFEYGNWSGAKNEYLGISQAEIFKTYTDQIPGQIVLNNADNITIRRCTVRHMGSCGILLYENSNNNVIEGCTTYDTTGAGISIGKWWQDARKCPTASVCTNTMICNNIVRNTGRDYWQGTGINIFAAYDCKVYHNDISDTAYTALHARIGDSPYVHPKIGKLEYKYNKISRAFAGHKWGIGDGGHYYMHGPYPDSVVSENYSLHANRNVNMEYYPDNHSYKTLWERNVSRWSKSKFAFYVKGQGKVTVRNNFADHKSDRHAKKQTVVKNDQWPQEAKLIMANAGLEPQWKYLLDGIYGHENLAQGKRCWASSENGSKMSAAKAADDNWGTFWHTKSGGDGQGWWAVDLADAYVIQKITILPRQDMYQEEARRNIEVQASNDPEFKSYIVLAEQNSVPWYNKTSSHATNLWEQFINIPTAYRYLRVKAFNASGSLNFAEFGAFGYKPKSRN